MTWVMLGITLVSDAIAVTLTCRMIFVTVKLRSAERTLRKLIEEISDDKPSVPQGRRNGSWN